MSETPTSGEERVSIQPPQYDLRTNINYDMLPVDKKVDPQALTIFRNDTLHKLAGKTEGEILPQYENDISYWNRLYSKVREVTDRLSQAHTEPFNDEMNRAIFDIALNSTNETIHFEQLAYTDELTGAVNRRRLDEVTQHLIQRRKEQPEQEGEDAVVFLDGDRFKSVNDRFGHPVGDAVLKTVVETLKRQVRAGHTVGRYGGEEFVLLLPNIRPVRVEAVIDQTTQKEISPARTISPKEVLSERLEAIREIIASTVAPIVGVEDLTSVTASIGATFIRPEDQTPAEVYNRADKDLYSAKHDTRNCVYIDGERITPREEQRTIPEEPPTTT